MSNAVYDKIATAIEKIKASDLKKAGINDHKNYTYFTPEQVSELVTKVSKELKLLNLFSLKRNELGIYGELTVMNLELSGDQAVFEMAAAIPEINASNLSQQLGGAMTYTKRYMLMNVYEIADNTLDFDALGDKQKKKQQQSQDQAPKNRKINSWASQKDVDDLLALVKAGNYTRAENGLKYWEESDRGISKAKKKQVIDLMQTLKNK